jgi:MFS family permease
MSQGSSFMALAFFGNAIGALGWAVVSDTSPKEAGGVSGGLFNTFGNLSSITAPIIIGYILAATGSFNGALVFFGRQRAFDRGSLPGDRRQDRTGPSQNLMSVYFLG